MSPEEAQAIRLLRSPATIRERCGRLLELARADGLEHFAVRDDRLEVVAERVAATTREAYPDLDVPYHSRWRHFDRPRLLRLEAADPGALARSRIDLAVTSVLLDAGAGPDWRWTCPATGASYSRSEGLAVASLELFLQGGFSSDPDRPFQADAAGLRACTPDALGRAFQVSDQNPLVGLEGRAALLTSLGEATQANTDLFGSEPPRPGGLYDHFLRTGDPTSADAILGAVLEGLGPIWPGRVELAGVNLGDVWPHPALPQDGPGADLVPFHKLSQWLSYSLLEPLEDAGLRVVGLGQLTGLPEYRNGGLLLDLGALALKDPSAANHPVRPDETIVVEWRALTVSLLDEVAERVQRRLGVVDFPLAKVLQGGTWAAGRQVARELRADGGPPLRIDSDGTVF